LLSKKIKIEACRTIILPVVLYDYEMLSLKLRGKQRLRVFENRVLKRIIGPKWDEIIGDLRNLQMMSSITCNLQQI
jgi:hypothetical protein